MINKNKNTIERPSEGRQTTNDGKCAHKYKRGTNRRIKKNGEGFVIREKEQTQTEEELMEGERRIEMALI